MTAEQTVRIAELEAGEAAYRAKWEAETVVTQVTEWNGSETAPALVARGVTIKELRAAFELVQDEGHWKNPIRARIHGSKLMLTIEAIKFFHGSQPDAEPTFIEGYVIVTSDGYQG